MRQGCGLRLHRQGELEKQTTLRVHKPRVPKDFSWAICPMEWVVNRAAPGAEKGSDSEQNKWYDLLLRKQTHPSAINQQRSVFLSVPAHVCRARAVPTAPVPAGYMLGSGGALRDDALCFPLPPVPQPGELPFTPLAVVQGCSQDCCPNAADKL